MKFSTKNILFPLFFLGFLSKAFPQYSSTYLNAVQEKRKRILFNADSTVANSGDYKFGFTTAEAFFCASRFANNATDYAKYVRLGRKVFDACFARMSAIDATTGRPISDVNTNFGCFALMACYTRYKHLLTDSLAVKNWAKAYSFRTSGANTSNLTLMGAAGAYLAAQNFGVNNLDFGYSSTGAASADVKSGKALIESRLTDAHRGIGEIASMPYGTFNLDPFLCIAEFSTDPILKQKAQIVFETAMAQYASVWLKGNLCMGSSRTYPHNTSVGQVSFGLWQYLCYFFGGGGNPSVENVLFNTKRGDHLNGAVRDYVLPEIFFRIATDRSQAFTAVNHILAGSFDYVNLSYIHQNYGMYTASVRFVGTNAFKTGVKWNTPSFSSNSQVSSNCLWVTSPGNDSASVSVGRIDQSDAENSTLYEGTMLHVYNGLMNTHGRDYALGFVPGGHLAHINEAQTNNRIYLYYPNILIAISSTNRFNWNPNQFPIAAGADKSLNSSEFRITDTLTKCFGIVIETAVPEDFAGATNDQTLLNFRNAVNARSLPTISNKALDINAKPRLKYTDHKGNQFVLTYRGTSGTSQDTINGIYQDYLNMPSMQNPFINRSRAFTQATNGAVTYNTNANMVMTYGSCSRTYNYANWSIADNAGSGCNLVIPVELLLFEAKAVGQTNILTWKTASEVNNLGFDIERSFDAVAWEKIGFEKAKGNNSTYQFNDNTPLSINSPSAYYRLRQRDINGETSDSKILNIQRVLRDEPSIYPTFTSDRLFIKTNEQDFNVLIFNALGKLIFSQKAAKDINIAHLPAGNYWLRLDTPQNVKPTVLHFVKL